MKSVALVLLLAFTLSGCLIMRSDNTVMEGTEVSAETLAQIQPGTAEDFALNLLGAPTSREAVVDGSEILRWSFQRTRKRGTAIFIIFAGSRETKETGTLLMVLRDKKVERIWREGGSDSST